VPGAIRAAICRLLVYGNTWKSNDGYIAVFQIIDIVSVLIPAWSDIPGSIDNGGGQQDEALGRMQRMYAIIIPCVALVHPVDLSDCIPAFHLCGSSVSSPPYPCLRKIIACSPPMHAVRTTSGARYRGIRQRKWLLSVAKVS
jgi:hypothetical protein